MTLETLLKLETKGGSMEGQGLIYHKFVILQPFDVNSLAHESIHNISSRKFHKLIVKLRIRGGFLKKNCLAKIGYCRHKFGAKF